MSTATRGFASMPKEKRAACGRIGALAAHKCGRAYRWTSETAREAGRRGGVVSGVTKRAKRDRDRRQRIEKAVVPPAPPESVPVPTLPPSSPLMLFAEHLKKVVSDALKGV